MQKHHCLCTISAAAAAVGEIRKSVLLLKTVISLQSIFHVIAYSRIHQDISKIPVFHYFTKTFPRLNVLAASGFLPGKMLWGTDIFYGIC